MLLGHLQLSPSIVAGAAAGAEPRGGGAISQALERHAVAGGAAGGAAARAVGFKDGDAKT